MTNGEYILKCCPDFMENALLIADEKDFQKFANTGKNLICLDWWNSPCQSSMVSKPMIDDNGRGVRLKDIVKIEDVETEDIVDILKANEYKPEDITRIFNILQSQTCVIGGKIWSDEDIFYKAQENNFDIYKEDIEEVKKYLNKRAFEDCNDSEWEAIDMALKNYADVNMKKVTNIVWDKDEDPNINLPDTIWIPKDFDDEIADDLSDKYGYLIKSFEIEGASKNWLIGICSSACDGVITYRVIGTEEQIKKYLLDLVNEDRYHDWENGTDDWEHGTEVLSDISENEKGLYAYGCYHDYHIDYTATVEEEPEVL